MIYVIDYGAGNIGSVLNMIKKVGGNAVVTSDPDKLRHASKVLLPGVGAFDNAVRKLEALGCIEVLKEKAADGTPLFGICLGMQLLANSSEEGKLPGLGLIDATVRRFSFLADSSLKVPHMGWNRTRVCKPHPLTMGIDDSSRFYFVHSYHLICSNQRDVLLETDYGYSFVSGVQHDNVMGVQFHPEKSHRYGMQLIHNFIDM